MKSIGEKIADGIQKFYTAFIRQRVLTTPEEVQANTNEKNLASAVVVGEIYNNLKGFEPILDSTGKITGYKTSVGGADTVFPFSGKDNLHILTGTTSSGEVIIPKNLELVCIQYSSPATSVASQAANYSHNVSCACSASYDPTTGKCSFWCQGKTNGAYGKTVYGSRYDYKIMYWQD